MPDQPTDPNTKAPTKAIALQYDRETDPAPRVVATGKGAVAEALLEIAREHGVPIKEDAALAEILAVLELDSFIPLEAYTAVAEMLNYLYRQNAKKQGS